MLAKIQYPIIEIVRFENLKIASGIAKSVQMDRLKIEQKMIDQIFFNFNFER